MVGDNTLNSLFTANFFQSEYFAFPLDVILKSLLFTAASCTVSLLEEAVGPLPSTSPKPFWLDTSKLIIISVVLALAAIFYLTFGGLPTVLIVALGVFDIFISRAFEDPKKFAWDLAETSAIGFFLHFIMSFRYSPDLQHSDIVYVNVLALVVFSWPLVDGSITVQGTLGRLLLFFLYPFAYSDSATSEAYLNGSMKPMIDNLIPFLQAAVVCFAISALKGQTLEKMKRWPCTWNPWAVFGLILFPILATPDLPMVRREVNENWYESSWTKPTQELALTPFIYHLMHRLSS